MQLTKKYTIKIPKNISIIYSESLKIIILTGPLGKKILRLKTKIFFDALASTIYVTKFPFAEMSANQIRKLKILQSTFLSVLKQNILEIITILHKKLNFIGVGYKCFIITTFTPILHLKLGYSHSIFFKLSKKIDFFCFKNVALFIFGMFFQEMCQIASKIRRYKIPEVYKGKGILYENEIVTLKKGKKV